MSFKVIHSFNAEKENCKQIARIASKILRLLITQNYFNHRFYNLGDQSSKIPCASLHAEFIFYQLKSKNILQNVRKYMFFVGYNCSKQS